METQKKYKFGDLRLRLLKATSEILSEKGIKRLTMRSLSSKVGVSRTAPYRHFENKDALLLALAEKGFNELTLRYQKINYDNSLDSLLKLQNIALAHVEFAIINPGPFRLMFGQEIIQHQRSEKLFSDAKATFSEYLIAIKTFQTEKNVATVDYLVLANYFWTIVHGLAILLIDDQIQIRGQNYGLPTLLNAENPNIKGDVQAMITFSKQTIMRFWDVIFNGISNNNNLSQS